MRREAKSIEEEIEVLKSLHTAWATLNKLKTDCEMRTWPFFDSKYSTVLFNEQKQSQFLIKQTSQSTAIEHISCLVTGMWSTPEKPAICKRHHHQE